MPNDDESVQEVGNISLRKSLIGIAEMMGYCERIYCVNGKPSKTGEPAFTPSDKGAQQYFQCKVGTCKKRYKGPSPSSMTAHLRDTHSNKCPEMKKKNEEPVDRGIL